MPSFFVERDGGRAVIVGDDARHLARSLRARVGEEIEVIDPAGLMLTLRLDHVSAERVEGTVVSMAGFAGPTPNGIRVAWVYTPPDNRGKGFAGACVAALSQKLLDEGRKFCFLYTDLANPISNHVYQRIGYEPVTDATVYSFS